jgi:sec-independent protein translocase protein TatB
MFGISFAEMALILMVALIIIGPKDLPEVSRYLIKFIAKSKRMISSAKKELNKLGEEVGIEDIKNEIALEMVNEKVKLEEDLTTIIDIYGNEHQVPNIENVRNDKSKEDLLKEVEDHNQKNQNKTNLLQNDPATTKNPIS